MSLNRIQFVGTVTVSYFCVSHPDVFLDGISGEVNRFASVIRPIGMIGFGHYGYILVARRLRESRHQYARCEKH